MSVWSLVSFAGFRACLIYMCLTVYEFSFILLIHHIILLILIFVLSVTFWTLTYYKIWILLIIYCFIWNYWIIYFVTCLECYELTLISWLYTPGNHAWSNRHCYPIGCVIKTPIRAYVVVVQLLTFLNLHFIMEWLLQSYFSYKINLNRHIKHENLLSIYENMDYFQIMLFIVTCSVFQKI